MQWTFNRRSGLVRAVGPRRGVGPRQRREAPPASRRGYGVVHCRRQARQPVKRKKSVTFALVSTYIIKTHIPSIYTRNFLYTIYFLFYINIYVRLCVTVRDRKPSHCCVAAVTTVTTRGAPCRDREQLDRD